MKTQWQQLARLGAWLVLSVPGFAQGGPSLNGSYAFLASAKQYDSFGETGGAVLSVLNFDGAGNVSGTAVLKARTGEFQDGDTGTGVVRGTYTTNPDGTGSVTLDFTDFGFSVKAAVVITDSGKGLQFADAPGNFGPATLNPALPGTPERVAGAIAGGYFLQNFRPGAQAGGTIPVTLTRTYNDGVAVYSLAAPATGTGPVMCPDGTSGTWSATIPSITAVIGGTSGNFLMPVLVTGCGSGARSNYSGLANLSSTPTGISLVLHLTGYFIVGSGRATNGTAPKGVYGAQFIGEPFPQAAVQTLNFDGSGGIKATTINAGGTTAFTGTYMANPDGSGTYTLTQDANPTAPPVTFAYATADDGATIYLLRTSGGGGGGNVVSGAGRLQ
jgi:hypothetical protein